MGARSTAAVLAATGLVSGLLTGAAPASAATSPGTITTIAGGPGRGPATRVYQQPTALAVGSGGALYVGDIGVGVVREFSNTGTFENVFAGGGGANPGDGGPAAQASVNPGGLAVDSSGNVVIANTLGSRIQVVAHSTGTFYGQAMRSGDIYTVAGTGKFGFSGDGGPATAAELQFPEGVAVDGAGNLVIADTNNNRIRVVATTTGTFYGQAMTAGDIYTVSGTGTAGFSGDGGPAAAAEVSDPYGVTADKGGNLVISDRGNSRIRVVAHATGTSYGQAMTAGDIYTVAGNGTFGYSGNGGPATKAALYVASDVAVDPAGNLAIAGASPHRVRVVAVKTGTFFGQAMKAGDIYSVAGDGKGGTAVSGGLATSTNLGFPNGVAFDAAGNLLIADAYRVWVVAAKTGRFYNQAMTAHHSYIVAGNGGAGTSGSGGKATNAEILGFATDEKVAVDGGNYVVLAADHAWFIANKAGTYFGRAMTAGDIYSVAGNGFPGYSGDGGIATSARFWDPRGVAADAAGNLVIADTNNARVRVVAATTGTFYGQAMTAGDVYTVAGNGSGGYSGDGGPATAAGLGDPYDVAVDGTGNLVISDGTNRIRVVAATTGTIYGQAMTAGDIYTVAGNGTDGYSGDGGPATAAELKFAEGVAVDGAGNIVIADSANSRIRVVAATTGTIYGQAMTAGDIYTVAGTSQPGYSGDGGPAAAAELNDPLSVAVDPAGNIVIADYNNVRVRVVAAGSGTFYGEAMTAGDIYTVAGDGTVGFSGDGGPATAAELNSAPGVAVDGAGNLIIADWLNGRVRMVTG